jgi:hypothetical protein
VGRVDVCMFVRCVRKEDKFDAVCLFATGLKKGEDRGQTMSR